MTKKQQVIVAALGMVIGIVSGIAGTAFAMGAEQQRIKDDLISKGVQIQAMEEAQDKHANNIAKEMDRYAQIIAAQVTQLQTGVSQLTITVGDLRTDVHVLKAIMERMESQQNRD